MTEPNTYCAYFTLVGEFDPAEITAFLGLKPTRSWKKGDINEQTKLERKHSRWCLDSRLENTSSLEKHIADVLDQLRPHIPSISELRSTVDGGMQLVAYYHTDYPGFSLDDSAIFELAQLKLGIDCDFYYLYSNKREDS
jgi:hypothetical protein